jgi:hypothetical protein
MRSTARSAGPEYGEHLNPAVSLGLWAGGRFPASELFPYIVAQVLDPGNHVMSARRFTGRARRQRPEPALPVLLTVIAPRPAPPLRWGANTLSSLELLSR